MRPWAAPELTDEDILDSLRVRESQTAFVDAVTSDVALNDLSMAFYQAFREWDWDKARKTLELIAAYPGYDV